MAKRTFAIPFAVLVVLLGHESRAQPIPVMVDGCARLARIIYTETYAAAAFGPLRSGPWPISAEQADMSICRHVTKTVSRAFTAALRGAGIAVAWADGSQNTICPRRYLTQCRPVNDPGVVSVLRSNDSSLIDAAWTVVARSVMREMYNPHSSDEVRFQEDELRLRIGLLLRSVQAR